MLFRTNLNLFFILNSCPFMNTIEKRKLKIIVPILKKKKQKNLEGCRLERMSHGFMWLSFAGYLRFLISTYKFIELAIVGLVEM